MKQYLLSLVVSGLLATASPVGGQTPMGALAIDERQGDQWGWAVDYETADAARARALGECGAGCSVVLTFARCGAYAADQDADSTAVGWAEAYDSATSARAAALAECRARGGGSGCIVRVWGCNGPVVEEGLGLDRSARRQVQVSLQSGGFDPGGADGLFGPRTRAAIRRWQTSRGLRATGYLDGPSAEALRTTGAPGASAAAVAAPEQSAGAPAAATAEQEILFWQSIANSTNAADFEAYLAQFPNGVFSALAQGRLAALRSPPTTTVAAAGAGDSGATSAAPGGRVPAATGRPAGAAVAPGFAGADARRQPGESFRDCAECPEMVVLPGGRVALGRYEVTVGEYRAFASATGGGAGGGCGTLGDVDSWRNPGFRQTDRHPVTCVSWDDAQEYVSWLSRTSGESYRLPTEDEWDRAAAGTPERGCGSDAGQRERGTLFGRLVRCQRGGPVGHGRQRVGMDGGLLARGLRPPGGSRRFLEQQRGFPAARRARLARRRSPQRRLRFSCFEDAGLGLESSFLYVLRRRGESPRRRAILQGGMGALVAPMPGTISAPSVNATASPGSPPAQGRLATSCQSGRNTR